MFKISFSDLRNACWCLSSMQTSLSTILRKKSIFISPRLTLVSIFSERDSETICIR